MNVDDVRVIIKGADRGGMPLDVFGSLGAAIGILYPNARMGPGEHGQDGVTLIIPASDRDNTVKGRKRAIAAGKEHRDHVADDVAVLGFDGESMTTTTPREAALMLAHYGLAFLEGTEGAVNNVTQGVSLPDGRGLTFTVQWAHGESPAAQRDRAREQIKAADALHPRDAATGECTTCHVPWPCPTATALGTS